MADANKTEDPTPKKLREARKQGNVAMSRDASNVLTYLVAISILFTVAGRVGVAFREYYTEVVFLAGGDVTNPDAWFGASSRALILTFTLLAPFIFTLAVVGGLAAFAQVGVLFSAETMKPSMNKLNPIEQAKNWFSIKGLFEFSKTLLKLFFVFLLGYLSLRGSLALILRLGFLDPAEFLDQTAGVARKFLFTVGIVFAGLGGLDFGFQRWQWKDKLKMSKDEVKREYKEQEGDPHIKGQRRSLHHEIVNQDVAKAVAGADAVVVNPTHIAVAVHYKKGRTAAPKVTAKGRELLAKKIVKLAKKHEIPIVRDITLARALFEVELDAYVPKDLYDAVAEILMFAWKIRREAGGDSFSQGLP